MSAKLVIPNINNPIVDEDGRLTTEWARFLVTLTKFSGGGLTMAKGDIMVYNGDRMTNLAVGSNATNLEADSTTDTGTKWA